MTEEAQQEPSIQQDTGLLDINAGTAIAKVGGKSVTTRSYDKGGDDDEDEEEARRKQLADKEALTHGMADNEGPDEDGFVMRDGKRIFDPDNDGDDDSTAEGDTDHDFVLRTGKLTPKGLEAKSRLAAKGKQMQSERRPRRGLEQAAMATADINDLPDSCLAGETLVVTPQGDRSIKDLIGRQTLLTDRGWIDAEIRSFGLRTLRAVTLNRDGVECTIYVTPNHRWYTDDGIVLTDSLLGLNVPHVEVSEYDVDADRVDAADHRVAGDTEQPSDASGRMIMIDPEAAPLGKSARPGPLAADGTETALSVAEPIEVGVGQAVLTSQVAFPTSHPSLVAGLDGGGGAPGSLPGAVLALGEPRPRATDVEVGVGALAAAQTAHDWPHVVDWRSSPADVGGHWNAEVPASLVVHHAQGASVDEARATLFAAPWEVVAVRPTARVEEVFCPVVPLLHRFVLAGGILTGNSFAYIESGGSKDSSGKTTPRSLRHYPVHDKAHADNAAARAAAAMNGGGKAARIARAAMPKIRAAQKKFGSQSMNQEAPGSLATVLQLAGTIPGPVILQEASQETGGSMKVKVPFYVAESISQAPGFDKKIYFPRSLLPSIVQEGKQQIAQGRQPLTVYARHAHATSGDHLPVGDVVDLEQEGRIGYATLEIVGTQQGKDLMALLQATPPKVNAVSLRSGPGRFELEEKKVNGELMLQASRLVIDGIDFAPDSPAMPTYGVEVLAAEARVDDIPTPQRRQQPRMSYEGELTLDIVRQEYPDLVQEIEAPYKKQLRELTAEKDALVAEKVSREREAYIDELAAKFPDPHQARPVLAEMWSDCKSRGEIERAARPVMMLLEQTGKFERIPQKSATEKLLELFPNSGAGQSLKAETGAAHDPFEGLPRVAGLPVPLS